MFDFNASLNDVVPVSPISSPVDLKRMEKSGLLMDAICVLFLVCFQYILSVASVVLDFNASLIDAAPVSPILFPVDLMRMEKSKLLMYTICMFLLCSQLRLSFVSVVLDFNASLNDVVPLSPISSPVDLMKMEKSGLLMDAICVLFLLCIYHQNRAE